MAKKSQKSKVKIKKEKIEQKKRSDLPSVVLIIVNYNGIELLKKHLPSITKTKYPSLQIVMIDNGSEDESVDFVQKKYSSIKVVQNDKNLGFGRANNIVFEKFPDADYYALLNNDMDVDPDWIRELTYVANKDSKIGAVAAKILHAKPSGGKFFINSAGGSVDRYFMGVDRHDGQVDTGQFDVIEEVDYAPGGAVLYRGDAIRKVGGFDERMFFYYEDVDLSMRIRDAGWKVMYNGRAVVFHDHMGTSRHWSKFKRTLNSNLNRIKSIQRRLGLAKAVVEFFRAPIEWMMIRGSGRDFKTVIERRIAEGS